MKVHAGAGVLAYAKGLADENPYPVPCSLARFPLYVGLAGLAWHLSVLNKGEPFWLPRADLAKLYNTSEMTVSRIVALLEKNGLITCSNPKWSFKGEKKCKEYAFVGPPLLIPTGSPSAVPPPG